MSITSSQEQSLFENYQPHCGSFDEMIDAQGHVRPTWQKLASGLSALGITQIKHRDEYLNKLIHENGITYNAYQSDESAARSWMMDLLPNLIAHSEWQWIENALSQRVHLFNHILGDVYGPQNLLKERHLPLSLILNNPGFLRPCHGFQSPDKTFINLYAADLARSPDGRWWVLSDRIEAPSGIGYALENRYITSHVLPEIFRECNVVGLQPFFQQMRESFEALVPRNTESPSIVMLTPGPANETYYEQSFLARNLGYPLVEGADLTVRDHCVYLKTVSGMERVDVILRRLDSEYCDPLELRSDSLLGIPGLVNAARMGNVAIANALGAGLLQTPALAAFLPSLCRKLLGQNLMMPSVATWWCGQKDELNYVLNHLKKLVLKPIFRKRQGESIFGPLATQEQLYNLRAKILCAPEEWCAQEQVAQATTPVFDGEKISPRHFLLRVFLVATDDGYKMMPGALTRITSDLGSFSVSMQEGGESQDTWVLSDGYQRASEFPVPYTAKVHIERNTADLPSRAADNIFWFGRYIERTENMIRILRMLSDQLIQDGGNVNIAAIAPFVDLLFPEEMYKELFPDDIGPLFDEERPSFDVNVFEKLLSKMLWDDKMVGSVTQQISHAKRTAFIIKERLSLDMWYALNQLDDIRRNAIASYERNSEYNLSTLNTFLLSLASISGGVSENMTRAHDWRFLEIGRRIERSINLAALLQNILSKAHENNRDILHNLLSATDSSYTYRGRYLTNLQIYPVLDLLIADDSNPRSIIYQTRALREFIQKLPPAENEEPFTRIEKLALRIYTRLRLADMKTLAKANREGVRTELDKLLSETNTDLCKLSALLGQLYFAHGNTGKLLKI